MAWHLNDGWRSCPEPSLREPEDCRVQEDPDAGDDWEREAQPVCPVCGQKCDFYIMDRLDGIIGCECCTRQASAWTEVYGA